MLLYLCVCALTILAIITRGTLPRYRVDQAITLHWKIIAIFLLTFYLETVVSVYIFAM